MKVVFVFSLILAAALGSPITNDEELVSFPEGRIVGGTDAVRNAYPYQVSLQYGTTATKSHICSGSILDPKHVLTVAHCVDGVQPSTLLVVAGAHNMKTTETTQQRKDVSRVVTHPAWNPTTLNNDIAVLTLSTPLLFNAYVKNITEAPRGLEPSGPVIATGWGVTANNGTVLPNALQIVQLRIVPRANCQRIYNPIIPIIPGMVCANSPGEQKGPCNGDAGSPLVCSRLGSNYQCGLASWGMPGQCGNPNYPGVYTNTANYFTWIQAQLAQF